MKLLLVAATKSEIEPLISFYGSENRTIIAGTKTVTILITGVGMVATAYALGRELAQTSYDLAINAGICGSFDHSMDIGEVMLVKEDHFAELGAENDNEFLAIDAMGFGQSQVNPIHAIHPDISIKFSNLKQARGITVNTVHGNQRSIDTIVKRLNPQTESMEGAAFFYACNEAKLPCIQLRSVSNYVEPRNISNWNITLAVKNLNSYLIDLVDHL
jgi:futalosine hydrolase